MMYNIAKRREFKEELIPSVHFKKKINQMPTAPSIGDIVHFTNFLNKWCCTLPGGLKIKMNA